MATKRAAGGGRKPLTTTEPTVRVAITLLASQAEAMKQLGNGNLSSGIRKAIETMASQKYSIQISDDTFPYQNLSKKDAMKIAREIARDEEAKGNLVFIAWYRSSDGQHGYLNSDGNHDITGKAW